MKPFDVYPLFNIEIARGKGCYTYDNEGAEYLDLYGGHAVISIGHSHPYYLQALNEQMNKLVFYSNSVQNPLQSELAQKLGKQSGYEDYSLFLINSGAEANENALKLASFHTGRRKVVAYSKAFHGRTSAAVKVTDNPKIVAPVNDNPEVEFIPFNDIEASKNALKNRDVCAVIVEGIQGVGGIQIAETDFLKQLREICSETGTVLILDEIQSGYGRSGKFFAHQYAGIRPDIITTAKGMGNGFPIGGVLISPMFEAVHGMLGTTFGGNHLACAAGIAVLDVMKEEKLLENTKNTGNYLIENLKKFSRIKEVRGRGLMIGIEMENPVKELRRKLLFEQKVFTGASGTTVIRLLPPLCLTKIDADLFLERFERSLVKQ
ncbi:MAG: aspartate aminotransferase family protein [Paludibacteraceae bacterium]